MAGKIKRQFGSWTDAEAAYRETSKANGAMQIAIVELVRGGVAWIAKNGKKVGTCRLSAAHGGVVILFENGYACAKYAEDWLSDMRTLQSPALANHEEYDSWVTLQELARQVRQDQILAMESESKSKKSAAVTR